MGVVENEQLFDELKLVLTEADEFPIITRLHSFLRLLYSDSTKLVTYEPVCVSSYLPVCACMYTWDLIFRNFLFTSTVSGSGPILNSLGWCH